MIVKKIPYDDDVRKVLWPSFKLSIAEKHGNSGAIGQRGEENAIKLIEKHYASSFQVCYDHSEDVVGQYCGIDLTLIGKSGTMTIDVKSGKTGLYWDKDKQYWYITIRDDFFDNPRKTNTAFMHVGPKGDLFVMYNKAKMYDYIKSLDCKLIKDKYGNRLRMSDWPDFVEHNLRKN
jgi:hypothetical protein